MPPITVIVPISPADFRNSADSFTKGYITAALWSSSAELGICHNANCPAEDTDKVQVDPSTERCVSCGGKVSGTDRSFDSVGFSIEECSPDLLGQIIADCAQFQLEMEPHITDDNLLRAPDDDTRGTYGHDFWLTRNGHGAGFWDGDYAEPAATALDKCAKGFGEFTLYIGDDGVVYGQ